MGFEWISGANPEYEDWTDGEPSDSAVNKELCAFTRTLPLEGMTFIHVLYLFSRNISRSSGALQIVSQEKRGMIQ
jgi:hypothetical protein